MDKTITIVRAVQTCYACPSQWSAWDEEGNYYYLRYRFGFGTVNTRDGGTVGAGNIASFEHGDPLDGSIELEEFAQLAGLKLELK